MSDPAGQEIRRLWGDLEVVDARGELRVFIRPEDVAKATRKDPAYCVFAQACRRQFHATKVLFYRSVAYIELPAQDGTRRVERFMMPDGMRDLVEAFDRGEGVIPDAGFTLESPSAAYRLDYLRRQSQRRRDLDHETPPARQKLEGTREAADNPKDPDRRFRDGAKVVDLSVRNGTGAVQFKMTRAGRIEGTKSHA